MIQYQDKPTGIPSLAWTGQRSLVTLPLRGAGIIYKIISNGLGRSRSQTWQGCCRWSCRGGVYGRCDHSDPNPEGLIGKISDAKHFPVGSFKLPITLIFTCDVRSNQIQGKIDGLTRQYIGWQGHGIRAAHFFAANKYHLIGCCPGTGAYILYSPGLGKRL